MAQGLATQTELLLARQEQARAQFDLQAARRGVADTQAALAEAVGISPGAVPRTVVLAELPLPSGLSESVDATMDRALTARPDLASRLADAARARRRGPARARGVPAAHRAERLGRGYGRAVHARGRRPDLRLFRAALRRLPRVLVDAVRGVRARERGTRRRGPSRRGRGRDHAAPAGDAAPGLEVLRRRAGGAAPGRLREGAARRVAGRVRRRR